MLEVLHMTLPSLAMLSLFIYLERDGAGASEPTKGTSRKVDSKRAAKQR